MQEDVCADNNLQFCRSIGIDVYIHSLAALADRAKFKETSLSNNFHDIRLSISRPNCALVVWSWQKYYSQRCCHHYHCQRLVAWLRREVIQCLVSRIWSCTWKWETRNYESPRDDTNEADYALASNFSKIQLQALNCSEEYFWKISDALRDHW